MNSSPLYTNDLINESSPYLLQHAHNPVNWYPWGDTAMQKAKALLFFILPTGSKKKGPPL